MESQLIHALKIHRHQPFASGLTGLEPDVALEPDGRVLVDLKATVTPALLQRINEGGGQVTSSFAQFNAIRALVPLHQLERLAAAREVRFISRAAVAITDTGSVNSQGDVTHMASAARTGFGIAGAGVKVGVVSDSVDYLANSQASGDLDGVTVLAGQGGFGTGEGTAMLEIIHDLAPTAQLFFATGSGGAASLAQNILNLRSNGCDIIVDDFRYANESPLQDGTIAQAVNTVTAGGALYFASAGNGGNLDAGA
ncbi:MAG: hypothetical protein DME25_05285, partial [Verrucomicrobia bacterium]